MSKYTNPIEKLTTRYSLVISALLVSIVLGSIIWICYQKYITATTPSTGAVKSDLPESFDKKTIDTIKQYHRPSDSMDTSLPAGKRINPFGD